MKVLIKDIERKIGYKLKRNIRSLGIDNATIAGLVCLKTDDEFLYVDDYMVLNFNTKDHKERYHTIVKTYEKIIDSKLDFVVLEDTFMGFSRRGSMELARMGGLVIAEMVKKEVNYAIIGAISSRAKFSIDINACGKGNTKKAIMGWVKSLGFEFKDNNLADGFLLALLGIIEGMDFRSKTAIEKEEIKKLSKPKKK